MHTIYVYLACIHVYKHDNGVAMYETMGYEAEELHVALSRLAYLPCLR